jgi:hypothetical protein
MAWSIESIATLSQRQGNEEVRGKAESLKPRIAHLFQKNALLREETWSCVFLDVNPKAIINLLKLHAHMSYSGIDWMPVAISF